MSALFQSTMTDRFRGKWESEKNGRMTGLEPATFGITIQRSNQLSYIRRK